MRDTIIKLNPVKDSKLTRQRGKKGTDTSKVKAAKDTTKKKGNSFDSEIKAQAGDTTIAIHIPSDFLILLHNARISFEDASLDADYIRVDKKNHLVFARGGRDPLTGAYIGRPIFKQKDQDPLICDSLVFNYVTKKGFIHNAASKQDGNFISGGEAKRLNEEEIAYRNVLYSTCDKPYPETDFGIVITKGIAEKHMIISGPAYLEIEGVPIPIVLPFGFFPKPDQRSSGAILPTFGEDQQLGFFLKGFGIYLGLSDYIDLTNTATYYSKGSFDVNSLAHYLKKYKYQGTLSLSFGYHKYGLETDPAAKDFNIQWSHSQDAAAHPGTTFSASVNAGTSSFYRNSPAQTNYNLIALTQNNLRSSIAYGKVFTGTPFNLSVNLSHSQDLTAKTVTLELPTFSLNMTSLSPFDKKDRVGEQKWYQRITVGYSLQGTNKINNVAEDQLFTSQTFSKRLQNGFTQSIPVSLSLNILNYFQFNSSINYTERDYFQTIRKRFARGSVSGLDSMVVDTVSGFRRAGDYSISTGLSTKVYNTMFFKGTLQAIRHVMTPSISFQYRPDFSDPGYGYYKTIVSSATIPYPYTSQKYSIFEQGVYGGPSGGKSAGLAFSLDNTIEAKLRARKSDTSQTPRKIQLLQGLSFSTFYNFIADSLKLSPISFSGRTSLFNNKLGINFGGTLNPYVNQVRDSVSNGQLIRYARVIDRYTFQDGKFPTLTNFNMSMSISLNSESLHQPNNPNNQIQPGSNLQNMNKQQAEKLALINSNPNAYVDFNIPWNISVSYSFAYNNTGVSTFISNSLNFNGDLNITPKWKIQYSSGFDVKAGQFTPTSISIYRDLHCWDLSAQWIPFGFYKFYNVTLKVKASVLQDLKLSKRKDYYNND
ncbi:putative LPS assembly protein LptD [Mucilaginibacter rivuli]|uniref:putative LPS assembly protein LptD n=1 Tax=Mucilaginibacter rivuli TaxID=2857527 RepID=UPI002101EDF6|nr:putative LPS assembly protein LptD [Mucilaginibacter rivuli]